MNGGIFLIRGNDQLVEMKGQEYDSEDLLQELLAKHPNLLAGDQMDTKSPRRWLLISREISVPSEEAGGGRWSLDHLFLDQDGVPTLVEVKRSSDTRIRREVIGQMLDYAANAVAYWPVEAIISKFEADNEAPERALSEFLGPEADQGNFWQKVKTNLGAGKVRLVFVADVIPSELRRVVEFLNQQMDPAEVLAVEIRQYVGEDLRTLVPRVIGQTEEARRKKGGGVRETRQWDEGTFFRELEEKQGKVISEIARRVLVWAMDNKARIWWGQGIIDGSFIPVLDHGGVDYFPVAVRMGYSNNANIQIQFQPLSKRPPFDNEEIRLEFLRKLNEISGVDLPLDSISRYPSIPLALMAKEDSLAKFLEAMDWVVQRIKGK